MDRFSGFYSIRWGVCHFKLSGFKEIQQIIFVENSDLLNQGEVITSVKYDDYLVLVHMPVEGRIISFNDVLLTDEKSILLQQPETNGWIALVVPCQLNNRTGVAASGKIQESKYI